MDSTVEKLSRSEIVKILSVRDGYECFICKEPFTDRDEVTIDHWKPLSKGGTWDIENLRLASKKCNALKGDRLPNPDGTLPTLVRERRSVPRAIKRSARPTICETCFSGRILLPGESCNDCGSGPQPAMAPRALQVSPKECTHSGTQHCWLCYLGFVPREAAIITVLDGEYLNE